MTRRWITTGSRRRLIKLVRGILKASVDRVSVSLRTCVSASARPSLVLCEGVLCKICFAEGAR